MKLTVNHKKLTLLLGIAIALIVIFMLVIQQKNQITITDSPKAGMLQKSVSSFTESVIGEKVVRILLSH